MQDSNQFNNIFRQIQNGHIKRSSAKDEVKVITIPEPPSGNSPPEEWEGYVRNLYQLLYSYMLESVVVYNEEEFDWCCKNRIYDSNNATWKATNYLADNTATPCYVVGEKEDEERLLNTEFGKALTNNIYIAHQHLTRTYEDEAFGLEEGEPI